MKAKLTYTENYALIVDESEIKEGDWYIDDSNIIRVAITGDSDYWNARKSYKKITWHVPLNGSPELEGVPLLPPIEDEVKLLAKNYLFDEYQKKYKVETNDEQFAVVCGYEAGYNKAKEKYKFTEEDMRKALFDLADVFFNNCQHGITEQDCVKYQSIIIQSLQQPKMPTEFEFEMETCNICGYVRGGHLSPDCCNEFKLKTITLPNGNIQAVGEYIY